MVRAREASSQSTSAFRAASEWNPRLISDCYSGGIGLHTIILSKSSIFSLIVYELALASLNALIRSRSSVKVIKNGLVRPG